jgi:DMSO/TMAO reductase YedYZ heme-binding membrane subunit
MTYKISKSWQILKKCVYLFASGLSIQEQFRYYPKTRQPLLYNNLLWIWLAEF